MKFNISYSNSLVKKSDIAECSIRKWHKYSLTIYIVIQYALYDSNEVHYSRM